MKTRKNTKQHEAGGPEAIAAALRQMMQPPEFRIAETGTPLTIERLAEAVSPPEAVVGSNAPAPPDATAGLNIPALAEAATSLWYLKVKFFKRTWDDDSASDDDPRVRRALGRISKGIDALKALGIEVEDRTNKRYPPGGAYLMRPIELTPTEGITYERVTDTVTPIVYFQGKLAQAGEVFVAVPIVPTTGSAADSQSSEAGVAAPTGAEQADAHVTPVASATKPPVTKPSVTKPTTRTPSAQKRQKDQPEQSGPEGN